MVIRVFTNDPRDGGSIPGHVMLNTQKIVLGIIRYGSRVSGAIQGREQFLPVQFCVVDIEKGAFG